MLSKKNHLRSVSSIQSTTSFQDQAFSFVMFKRTSCLFEKSLKVIVQIIDISGNILYNQEKTKAEVLQLINATISHEMRNPLNSILNQIFNLSLIFKRIEVVVSQQKALLENSAGLSSDEVIKKLNELNGSTLLFNEVNEGSLGLKILKSSSRLMKHQVDDILDFGRIKAGMFTVNLSLFNVKEIVDEIIEIQEYQAIQLGLKLIVDFQGFEEVGFEMKGDPCRLQQVLLNLLSNSLKFTIKGGIRVLLRPFYDHGSRNWMLQVAVRDSGTGIKDEDKPKLFKLFGTLSHSG